MSLEVRGRIVAGAKLQDVRGDYGLGKHRLRFNLEFETNEFAPQTLVITSLSGDLEVCGKGGGHVGRMHGLGPSLTMSPNNRMSEELILEATKSQLAAIEDSRAGGGLQFVVWLRGNVHHPQGLQPFVEHIHYQVNQSKWLEVLEQLQYARTMLLEVPLPSPLQDDMTPWFHHLKEAHQALTQGRWREAVGQCRDVLESLEQAAKAAGEDRAELPKDRRTWSKSQRYCHVQQALLILAHAARHADQVAQAIDWEREDAQTMLLMTASILRRNVAGP